MDVVQNVEEVASLDEQLHLFCPRKHAEDPELFFDEDLIISDKQYLADESSKEREKRKKALHEAEARTTLVLDACTILAFDGDDARPYQQKLEHALSNNLSRCDICVREYHRARTKLLATLEGQYAEDEVQRFMDTFDDMNKSRIKNGLYAAEQALLSLPAEKRSIATAGNEGLYALFEALNCLPILRDSDAMRDSFDRPFNLCQTNRRIKLPNYPPGMVAFLFSNNESRSNWALKAFANNKRMLTSEEFEYSVKPFLQPALERVHISCLEEDFLPTFWRAVELILTKSDGKIVSHNLRAMDVNLWTTSLEHFQIDRAHLDYLIGSHKILLQKAPAEYWEAMGSIQPQAVLDTIFKAPRLERLIKDGAKDSTQLMDKFDWLYPFLRSIKADNLVPPLRTVLDHMLDTYQQDSIDQRTRAAAFEVGMRVLKNVLETMREKSTRGPILVNMLELITNDYLGSILDGVKGVELKDELRITATEETCLDIVRVLLQLDCRALSGDRLAIVRKKDLGHTLSSKRESMWARCIRSIKPGHPMLSSAIMIGVSEVATLEALPKRQLEDAPKASQSWNAALARRQDLIASELLDKLQGSTSDQLLELVQDRSASQALFALIFSGTAAIYESSLDLLKTIGGEDSRRESLMYMLSHYLHITLTGTNGALKSISSSKAYAPCTNTLKLCTDIYSILCDDTDGLLRSGRRLEKQDLVDIEAYWQATWDTLGMMFQQTEPWSNAGLEKAVLQDFCRATMDFAGFIFDQHALLSGCLEHRTDDPAGVRLLARPLTLLHNIVGWLRLRDDYLIIKAVQLTCKMLGRFKEAKMNIPDDAIEIVKNIIIAKIKNRLTANQKAELQRALELCTGQSLKKETPTVKQDATKQSSKNGKLDMQAWSTQAAKDRPMPDRSVQINKQAGTLKAPSIPGIRSSQLQDLKRTVQTDDKKMNEFKMKRQKEMEEAKKRRDQALAKAKGLGAGSGVVGLGDYGKDHTEKGQNVMVSSDEESEDDDDLDEDLFGPQVKKDKKIRRHDVETFGATLKPEQKRGPTKIQRTARSFKDMRARLQPDLQPLHRTMLKWDYFHDGVYPPNSSEHQYRGVSNTFSDPSTYQSTFQPLLTLEAWQGMVKSRDENTSKPYSLKVVSRSNVDSFLEISSAVSQAENREQQLSEGDIILLSTSRTPADSAESPHCLSRVYRIKRQKAHIEVVYQLIPGGPMDKHLVMQASVYGVKVQSIIPLEREYGALQALQYYDLCTQIVRAKPSPRIDISEKQITTFQDIWNINRAQAEAINAALLNDGFSLIQGPPGSGKTKTIVAIVGGLLSDSIGSISQVTKISVPGQAAAPSNSGASRKLLICAPSNAAVDELVMRLKAGIKTRSGKHHMLNVVRIGRSEAINQQVVDVTMDELVAKRLGGSGTNDNARAQASELFKQHERVSAELKALYDKRDGNTLKGKEASDLLDTISSVRRRKQELGTRIDNFKDQERNAGREAELNRKKAQQAVLDQAHVICATLSGSGHDMFQGLNIEFETVIIDEAAQCVEMSSLIPLKYGCVKCILVGDPKQLPPTVFSKEAAQFQYEQSLFVRMQNNFPKEVYLLDTQYRMHPHISLFPSRTFYDCLLKDGPAMEKLRTQPWHQSELLAPYRFFDVQGQHQAAPRGHSLVNLAEIDVALALYSRLQSDFGRYDFKGKIGIITPYKSQLRALKERFSSRYGQSIFETIDFNTTDAFQGRESEVIIFSCVRASPAGGIGFLQDIRRMNVGLTRAKSSLWVLGNSDSLVRGQYWRKLVEDAKARDSYTTGDILSMLARPSAAFKAPGHADTSMHDASSHNGTSKLTSHDQNDRMDGVTYKFEDRVKQKRSVPDGDDGKKAKLKTAPLDGISADVEMKDADSTVEVPKSLHAPARPGGTKLTRPAVSPFMRPKARAPPR